MNARQHNAWLSEGGGGDLINEMLADRKRVRAARPATPAARWLAGSARRSKSAQDFSGLKMRIGGFAGKVFQTLGAEPRHPPKDGIYAGAGNRRARRRRVGRTL